MQVTVIEEQYLQRLRAAGLFVSEPFPDGHGWAHGVRIGKPTTTPGNSIPGFQSGFIFIGEGEEPPEMDGPMIVFYRRGEDWIVRAQECVPKPGPGDFTTVWTNGNDALQDILDFYFGSPERMQKKAARKAELRKRLASQ